MCGFVALISPAVPINGDLLAAMRDRLAHRGPDNAALWMHASGRIGLAHRRLSIIDTSHEADQPMVGAAGKSILVFNGEIYNYIELRSELKHKGIAFRTQSDSEVLLAAYEMWGIDCLARFNGMFAFAIFDGESKQLFIARDRFGEKPLFIGRGRFGTVAIASEMKAILAHPMISTASCEQALERYGTGCWYEDDSQTFFEAVERLPPAHAALFSMDGREIKRWRYWTPDYDHAHDIGLGEAIERFGTLLDRSLKLRLRADVPIGSSLSGGLDSSVVVGRLSKERASSVFTQNTFSACFDDDPTISEGPDINAVVSHSGVNSFRVTPTATGLMEESRRLHWHQEEPFLSASIYLQWCVARLAKQHSTVVLLDGQGADELLAGYQFYFSARQLDLLDQGRMFQALRETLRFTRRLEAAASHYSDVQRRFNPRVALTPEQLREYEQQRPPVTAGPYSAGVAYARPGYRLRRILSEALNYNSLPMLLRYADRNAMAFSRETRMPYLDYELVDFCIGLPDDLLIRNGWQKWILREAAGDAIPSSVRWRADKVGYAAPLDVWLRGALADWARERVFDARLSLMPGYHRPELERLWAEHQAGTANHSWALWRWVSLAEWLELRDRGWWRAGHCAAGNAMAA